MYLLEHQKHKGKELLPCDLDDIISIRGSSFFMSYLVET